MAKVKAPSAKSIAQDIEKFQRIAAANPHNEVAAKTLQALKSKLDAKIREDQIKLGLKFERSCTGEWWELIKLQYPITQVDNKFIVTSNAREWEAVKAWEFDDKYLALAKVAQLANWIDDMRKRGFGDRDSDVERLAAVAKAAEME